MLMNSARQLEALLEEELRPGLHKAKADAKRSSKLRAAKAFADALTHLRWSKRQTATYVGVDDKTIREWLDAGQQPAWIPLALPREGYMKFLKGLYEEAPPPSHTGTDGY